MSNAKEYYLGLDMGTSSVGWAVTDMNYKLLRTKGKDLWGVRLFEEAKTSEERRNNRISRRRRQREKARIGLLREFFAEEISKIDPSFYQRLDDSKYHIDDKGSKSKYSIFDSKNYNDENYYNDYPTIYNLRLELINSKKPYDVRLVFLALSNMFKHRGHFLNAKLSTGSGSASMADLYSNLFDVVYEELDILLPSNVKVNQIEEILSSKNMSRSKMAEEIVSLLNINKRNQKKEYEIIKGICGLKIKFIILFDEEVIDEENKGFSLDLRGFDEEQVEQAKTLIGEERFEVIEKMKQVHDKGLLSKIMKGYTYLSEARVADYEKHKQDLALLKKVIRKYKPESYDDMFRDMKSGNYSAYVNSVNGIRKKRRNVKGRNREEFYKTVKKLIDKMPKEDDDIQYILNEISNETFIPKQLTSSNGVIPNQVHLVEMKAILRSAESYLPFLKENDETGLSISEKIIQLFEFRIPYYVGPLSEQHKDKGGNAWIVRNEAGKVLPWNFEEKIDVKQSAEEFIKRMVRHCTYIKDERVLPKHSLLYERFTVLNELNNLRIRGESPSVELKQEIYNDLFTKGKKVSLKMLFNYLVGRGIIANDEITAISGIDQRFSNSLSSLAKFTRVLGEEAVNDEKKNMIEKIIFWSTVYSNDKKFLRQRIKHTYNEELTDEQIKKVLSFKFNDWGKLSREFLEMPGCDKSTGETLPLINMLWERNENLMELLSNRYTYIDELKERTQVAYKLLSEFKYEDLDDMYLSNPVKRMIWQTIKILSELKEVLGSEPKRIFIEMAREDGVKGRRADSRKKKLIELYKGCKEDGRDWYSEIEETDDSKFRIRKLYLYYLQKGRCMYSGRAINLDNLFNDNLYDIDHIYPRRYVKDDSLENNLVLVEKGENTKKGDKYPIHKDVYKSQRNMWKSLLSSNMQDGFITREKYDRLVNRSEFTDEQLVGFISRQLVETRQGTKAVTQILEQSLPNTEIVYVKAGNVSSFRHQRGMLKTRSANDFHHANDAYLNIIVGNTYYVKFTKNPINFIRDFRKSPKANAYNMNRIFDYTVKRGDETAWMVADQKSKEPGTISTVKKMMKKNTPLITRMNFEVHGKISKETLYGAEKAKRASYIPIKGKDERMLDVKKYGGFTSVTISYFFLVEHKKRGEKIRTLEAMPLYLKDGLAGDKTAIENYCKTQLGLVEPDVRMERIKIQSFIKRNGFYLYVSGKTNEEIIVRNAVPLCLKPKWINYVKKIENSNNNGFPDKDITSEKNIKLYGVLKDKHVNGIYSKRPNPIGEKLIRGEGKFLELSLMEQCNVLNQIMQLTQLNNLGANLILIGDKGNTGKTQINKTISNCEEFLLVNQSVTGLYENEIDLLTV